MTDPAATRNIIYPNGDVEIPTIEVRHPAIISETGVEGVIRLSSEELSQADLEASPFFEARLEEDAPVDAGQIVQFIRSTIGIERPERSTTGVPQLVLRVQNADARIGQGLYEVARSATPAECTYRSFTRFTRLNGQPDVLDGLELVSPEINVVQVSVRAQGPDVVNRAFHRQRYDSRFPLLGL